MLALEAGTGNLIRAVTGSAADVEISISYVDYNSSTAVISGLNGDSPTNITTATTTTIVTGAASTIRTIKGMSYYNRSATSTTLRIEQTDGTVVEGLINCTLLQDETLVFTESGFWIHYDSNGAPYPSVGNVASQAEQEAGTATDKYVSPGRQHFHPSACKAWVTAGTTGNILASYNITSLTDTGTGDIAVTIANDFSSALYAVSMAVQRINSTAAEANCRVGTIKTASLAAGSFSMDCWDTTATTNVIKDPTTWHATAFGDL
jgi:hypothetical protein